MCDLNNNKHCTVPTACTVCTNKDKTHQTEGQVKHQLMALRQGQGCRAVLYLASGRFFWLHNGVNFTGCTKSSERITSNCEMERNWKESVSDYYILMQFAEMAEASHNKSQTCQPLPGRE